MTFPAQLCGDYFISHEIRIPNKQPVKWKVRVFFFSWLRCFYRAGISNKEHETLAILDLVGSVRDFLALPLYVGKSFTCQCTMKGHKILRAEKKMSKKDLGVSKNRGTPKSSILIGFSIITYPFWGVKKPYCLVQHPHVSEAI